MTFWLSRVSLLMCLSCLPPMWISLLTHCVCLRFVRLFVFFVFFSSSSSSFLCVYNLYDFHNKIKIIVHISSKMSKKKDKFLNYGHWATPSCIRTENWPLKTDHWVPKLESSKFIIWSSEYRKSYFSTTVTNNLTLLIEKWVTVILFVFLF